MVGKQSHGGEEDSGVRKPRVLGKPGVRGSLLMKEKEVGRSHTVSQ